MLISSCAETRLFVAAAETGRTQARVILPDLPPDCRVKEAHASVTVGAHAVSVITRERNALDRQNARTDRCSQWYDIQKEAIQ